MDVEYLEARTWPCGVTATAGRSSPGGRDRDEFSRAHPTGSNIFFAIDEVGISLCTL